MILHYLTYNKGDLFITNFKQIRKLSAKSYFKMSTDKNKIEGAKKLAAYQAVDNHIKSGFTVGIGSGSTVVYAVERLAQRVKNENLIVKCVPTSFQARQLVVQHNLRLTDLDVNPKLDVCIDGADEVDSNLTLINGGGGCLLQEKIVASCANELIIIADYTKNSSVLGTKYTFSS